MGTVADLCADLGRRNGETHSLGAHRHLAVAGVVRWHGWGRLVVGSELLSGGVGKEMMIERDLGIKELMGDPIDLLMLMTLG